MKNSFNPDVSIIMPAYNTEKFLTRSLYSCINQDFKGNIEVVLVNDGSTDNTLNLARSLKKELDGQNFRIHIYTQENKGVASACNIGIEESTSDVLLFLDSDDLYVPRTVRRCLETLSRNPSTGMVYSNHLKCDELGNVFSKRVKNDYSLNELLSGMYIGHVKSFHKHVLEEVDGFCEEFSHAVDYDLALRIALNPRFDDFIHIPEFLYLYTSNSNSLSLSGRTKQVECAKRALRRAFLMLNIKVEVPDPVRDKQAVSRYFSTDEVDEMLKSNSIL